MVIEYKEKLKELYNKRLDERQYRQYLKLLEWEDNERCNIITKL